MSHTNFLAWMEAIQRRAETALENLLPNADIAPTRLHEAMRYAVLGGGKRIRPLLVHAAGGLVGAAPERLDKVACAVELIHAYSLVHDDLPCMDNDVLRRGKPTVHIEYDDATALLVGDSLQALAFQSLSEHPLNDDPSEQLAMIARLARASGSRGMAGGQAIDLAAVGKQLSREELEYMHIHKTGALIRASVLLGAACGTRIDSGRLERLDHYGKLVGLLFQIVDDILDTQSDTATLGKTAGKDADNNKPTYVTLLGMTEARALAESLLADAREALTPFGPQAARLDELATFIVHRRF
ncbi:polyprenyl synthetase family protein [Aromatoleum bremense]|uniref:Geranyl transferase n=1 Tax=Aromatoleum bremense TaxID=76115 RepID=A0ABX1NUC0_9RHOO|nr:farnesyl diphosphate synthase [Aromatoleum bremense]NMG15609.1 geranyl transferase [Aromatoleum bremense]QTQ32868.1 putative farnesyl diphosphate synthase [Aromatoleum bremense]